MAEEISVRFANAKKEYLKSLAPMAFTNNFAESFVVKCDISTIDYDWVKNNILNTIEKIYMNDKIQTLILWCYDSFDADFAQCNIVYDPAGRIRGSNTFDPSSTVSDDMLKVAKMIFENIMVEIADIYLRCMTTATTISSTLSKMADDVGATIPEPSPKSDLDRLCDDISKNTKAEIVKPKETLDDYICNALLKEELEEIKNFFEHSATYKSVGITIPKGILFAGPPGTGKTYAARCIAGSTDCYFMQCTASSLQGQYIGSGAENIRMVFKGAKMLAEKSGKGVIIFVDEFDSLGDRQHRSGGASDEEDRTLNQFLAEMSGFTDIENIMVLAATNFPERLDDALTRSGRFGRTIMIDYPDDYERLNMVKYYFNKIKLPLSSEAEHDTIADLTKGLTPADIKEIANESGILTIRQSKTEITLDNINEAVNKVITKNIRHPDKSKKELDLVTAHEIGHVVLEVMYNNTIPIKVTNYAYGDTGGFTQSAEIMSGILPQERFINEVRILLGGRAAEEVVCGYITNGASNDLDKAKSLMYSYFKHYNFEPYEVDKLDQLVLDRINELYEETVKDLKKEDVYKVLKDLINQLSVKRVLYSTDIMPIVKTIRKVVF